MNNYGNETEFRKKGVIEKELVRNGMAPSEGGKSLFTLAINKARKTRKRAQNGSRFQETVPPKAIAGY